MGSVFYVYIPLTSLPEVKYRKEHVIDAQQTLSDGFSVYENNPTVEYHGEEV